MVFLLLVTPMGVLLYDAKYFSLESVSRQDLFIQILISFQPIKKWTENPL